MKVSSAGRGMRAAAASLMIFVSAACAGTLENRWFSASVPEGWVGDVILMEGTPRGYVMTDEKRTRQISYLQGAKPYVKDDPALWAEHLYKHRAGQGLASAALKGQKGPVWRFWGVTGGKPALFWAFVTEEGGKRYTAALTAQGDFDPMEADRIVDSMIFKKL